MPNIAAFGSYFCLVIVQLCWAVFVLRNAYKITISGLRKLYFVFVSHLMYMIISSILNLCRPFDGVVLFLHESTFLCHIAGRWYCTNLGVMAYFISLFAYLKTDLYVTLDPTLKNYHKVLKVGVYVGALFLVGQLFVCNSGAQTDEEGTKRCAITNFPLLFLYGLGCLPFFVGHFIVFYIFWKYRHVRHEHFPQLETQMKLNIRVVPIMFVSTCVIFGTNGCYMPAMNCIEWRFYIHHGMLLDGILNSMIMYISLYIFSEDMYNIGSEDTLGPNFLDMFPDDSSDDTGNAVAELGGGIYVWVAFPGAHPIYMAMQMVEKHMLQQFVMTEEERKHQVHQYQSRGCGLPCSNCYNIIQSTDELILAMDHMPVQNGQEDFKIVE